MKTAIEMARESIGLSIDQDGFGDKYGFLKKFEALVRADEREACAKLCEQGVDTEHPTVKGHIMKDFGRSSHLAKAIRARGQK